MLNNLLIVVLIIGLVIFSIKISKELFNLKYTRKFPDIRFSKDNTIEIESINQFGWDNNEFYIITDHNKLIYINDELTENTIINGLEDIIDITDNDINWLYSKKL